MNKKFLSAIQAVSLLLSMTVAATPLPTVRTVKQVLQVQNGLSRKMVFGYATVRRLPLKL